jgi:hypothetical protein
MPAGPRPSFPQTGDPSGDGAGLRSTSSEATPPRASVIAAASPAGPPPTTTTETRRVPSVAAMADLLVLGAAEALGGEHPGGVDQRAGVAERLQQRPQPGVPGGRLLVMACEAVGDAGSAGRRGVDDLAHLGSFMVAVAAATMRRRADVALPIRCGSAADVSARVAGAQVGESDDR